MNDKPLIAAKFRSLADRFRGYAGRELPEAEVAYVGLLHEAGELLIVVCHKGYLPDIQGMKEAVAAVEAPLSKTRPCVMPGTLFRRFCGTNHALWSHPLYGDSIQKGAKIEGGLLPAHAPDVLLGSLVNSAESREHYHAMVCDWVADSLTEPDAADSKASCWYHLPDEPRPGRFCFGPLEGNAGNLNENVSGKKDQNYSQLQGRGRREIIWVVRLGRYSYQVWFRTQAGYDAAKRRAETLETQPAAPKR